jgi:predicted alpha/beta-fold hydrolase
MIIIPGLTGNGLNLYVTSTVEECSRHGYDAVVINYRCNAGLQPTVINFS